MALLHAPLPVSFRLNLHRKQESEKLMAQLAGELQFPSSTFTHNGTTAVDPPVPIAWYPLPNVAWQLDCGRVALSKTAPKHAPVKRFHAALLAATDAGVVDRQEGVSMLPVLFLDVAPSHHVLDMCASPGSKTTQVLDFLAGDGLVVANDLDKKRAYMLVHRLSRNTLRHAVVTCGSGTAFPGLYHDGVLQRANCFDRVLCDVPCSGDGTLRKSQQLWKDWHIGQGLTLHPVQLALALRGAALLKVGGLLVYSTCSFNPVENEAVVAELLRRSDGALELVDVAEKLPLLVTRKGRTTWPVGWRSKSKSTHKGHLFTGSEATASLHDWYEAYDALPQELRGQRILKSMFPPASPADAAPLERTLRLIPIDQNSGGFFVAVLRKLRDLPSHGDELQCGLAPLEENLAFAPPPDYVCKLCNDTGHLMKHCQQYLPDTEFEAGGAKETAPPQPKKPRVDMAQEETTTTTATKRETPYRPIASDAWATLQAFYGLEDATLRSKFWCRSDTAATVNYVDDAIARACLGGDALEIVNTGLKAFAKLTERGQVYYRPTEEALGFVDGFFTKRLVPFTRDDLSLVLSSNAHAPFDKLSQEAQRALEGMAVGPAVARLQENAKVAINVWVGTGALLPRVSKTLKQEIEAQLQ
jgi:tRNA (cytosine34-C5)-methyltransferase